MKILICPLNGARNIDEFQYLGPVREDADPDAMTGTAWAGHLFRAENRPGIMREWWRHTASNTVFLAERDIVENRILRTFRSGEEPSS